MSSLRDNIVGWVDQRVEDMLAAPRMWGSNEAVEMQILQLMELRALALRPTQELESPRRVLETYLAYLHDRFPAKPSMPLFQLIGQDEAGAQTALHLCGFVEAILPSMLEENPFQHNDIAIQLTFERGRAPTTSAFTGYYEEFRRAARAVARPLDKPTGRPSKGVELATDFTLADARVLPKNGAPAEVLLLLGAGPGQRDIIAEAEVHDALSSIITMGEWASSSAKVADLPVDDVKQRTRLAVQTRRVLPSRGIEVAKIGGRLIGRSKPVEFRADHERRLFEVIGEGSAPEPFDKRDEIRAIDLDRGLLLLGKKARIPCYVRPEALGDITFVGVEARVMGAQYRPLGGRPFVLVESIEVMSGMPTDDA